MTLSVVAIGGHALAGGSDASAQCDSERIESVAAAIAKHLAGDALLVTHGNGPQAGWLAAQADTAVGPRVGLDAVTAQTEGLTGYQLELALENVLPGREITTLLTQVEVDPADPELGRPSKPIGRTYDHDGADCLRARGLSVGAVPNGFRRIVPSPMPVRVREERAIGRLLGKDGIVVCGGGGGIAIVRGADGQLHGVDAIIDKDHTSALLACRLNASRLFLLTDVPGVHPDWPETRTVLRSADPAELALKPFSEGSMGPKVAAAVRYATEAGGPAWIGRIEDLEGMIRGTAGTRIEIGAKWEEGVWG